MLDSIQHPGKSINHTAFLKTLTLAQHRDHETPINEILKRTYLNINKVHEKVN